MVKNNRLNENKNKSPGNKIAYLNKFIDGMSHEFNNLLHIISGYSIYGLETKDQQSVSEAFENIRISSHRASAIIKQFLIFSGKEAPNKTYCSIVDIVEGVLSKFKKELNKNKVNIHKDYGKIPEINAEKESIAEVFGHIFKNAIESFNSENKNINIIVKIVNKYAEISFQDSGIGIRKENLENIFHPFFSTKIPSRDEDISGLGLGLFVSYGIINRHGGTINVNSKPGEGSTFTIKLPIIG